LRKEIGHVRAYNATVGRVRVTIVAVEKPIGVKYGVSVCSFSYPARKAHAP